MIYLCPCISLFVLFLINNPVFGREISEKHAETDNITEIHGERRIIGGRYLEDEEYDLFPHQGLLKYDSIPWCSVSVLNNRWFLTAAHCIDIKRKAVASVHVGSIFLNGDQNSEVYQPALLVAHPNFKYIPEEENGGIEYVINDIGLIKSYNEIRFSARVQPVQIGEFYREEHIYATIAGWGKSQNYDREHRLRFTTLYLLSRKECQAYWPYIQGNHLCTAIDPKTSLCYGDSGGALVINGVQIGIQSTAADDCGPSRPNLFTRVNAYQLWIKKVLAYYT